MSDEKKGLKADYGARYVVTSTVDTKGKDGAPGQRVARARELAAAERLAELTFDVPTADALGLVTGVEFYLDITRVR